MIHIMTNPCDPLGGPVYVVMEHADSGNLKDYLHAIGATLTSSMSSAPTASANQLLPRHMNRRTLMHYAMQVARGMSYIALKRVSASSTQSHPILVCSLIFLLVITTFKFYGG